MAGGLPPPLPRPSPFSLVVSDKQWLSCFQVLNETGPTQDRASIYYNPFTSKWVYSIKTGIDSADPKYQLGRYFSLSLAVPLSLSVLPAWQVAQILGGR